MEDPRLGSFIFGVECANDATIIIAKPLKIMAEEAFMSVSNGRHLSLFANGHLDRKSVV